MAYDFNLFNNQCAGCGKVIKSYATSRSGDLPTVFCDSVCETNYQNKKRMYQKPITHTYDKRFQVKEPIHIFRGDEYMFDATTGEAV